MNGKDFLIGFLAGVIFSGVLSGGYCLLRYSRRVKENPLVPDAGGTPAEELAKTEAEKARIREELSKLSNEALAARFTEGAKKEGSK